MVVLEHKNQAGIFFSASSKDQKSPQWSFISEAATLDIEAAHAIQKELLRAGHSTQIVDQECFSFPKR